MWFPVTTRRAGSQPAAALAAAVAPLAAAIAGLLMLAVAAAPASAVGRHAAMVVDANSGRVLHAMAADEPRYPASLTKMMTLYMVFELIEQGRLTFQTRITVSETAAAQPPSKLDVSAGDTLTVGEAVRALITKSANDVAVAVAEHIAGSSEKFAALMTRKARQLGMRATTFRNPHGLPDEGQITTARDMITLGLRLQDDFPQHFHLFSLREFRHQGDVYRNHNGLLTSFEGTNGIKTGYTRASGFNVVTSVKRDGRHVVGVVFGGATAGARDRTMRSILSAALIRAATERSRPHSAIAQARPVPAPRPVARPMPVAAQAPATTTPSPPVTQWPATISANAPAPAITSAQANPKVEMARVRPLMIAPAQAVRAPRAGSGTAQAAAQAPGGLQNGFSASPPAADTSQPARIELPALPPPIEPATASASATPGTSRAFEDIAPAQTPAATPQFRGAQPSTLQAQAQNLARGAPAVPAPGAVAQPQPQLPAQQQRIASAAPTGSPYRLNGPQPVAAGTLAVQVGAYNTVAEAERQLERTRNALPDRLSAGAASAVPALVGGKQVYRARFTGFDAEGAARTCTELRRRQIDCHVARAD